MVAAFATGGVKSSLLVFVSVGGGDYPGGWTSLKPFGFETDQDRHSSAIDFQTVETYERLLTLTTLSPARISRAT